MARRFGVDAFGLALVVSACCCLATGCFAARTPAQTLSDAAHDLNMAARFGRLDLALEHTAAPAQKTFLERRAAWGRDVRVVDVNLSGLDMQDPEHAEVDVDLSWVRQDEGLLRSTRVRQTWENTVGEGWELARERHVSGDLGLFGEARPAPVSRAPRPDVHFPSRTIR